MDSSARITDEEMVALDLLEKRVENIERKILGKTDINQLNLSKMKPILNALHEVDTVLISSISGKEKINTLLNRVDFLNEILDPSYLDTIISTDAKAEAILESEKELRDYMNSLNEIDELQSVLNSDTIEGLPNLTERINNLLSNMLKTKEECDRQTREVVELTNEYKNCMVQISSLLIELNSLVTTVEIECQPKPVVE